MNIYVKKEHKDIFIKKLKESQILNDIFLSEERLDKIKFVVEASSFKNKMAEIVNLMTDEAMIINRVKKPSKEYVLCVGEIAVNDFSVIERDQHIVLKRDGDIIRFNSWIKVENINEYFRTGKIMNFKTLEGLISENTMLRLTVAGEQKAQALKSLENMKANPIVKKEEIFAFVSLNDISTIYKETENHITKFEII